MLIVRSPHLMPVLKHINPRNESGITTQTTHSLNENIDAQAFKDKQFTIILNHAHSTTPQHTSSWSKKEKNVGIVLFDAVTECYSGLLKNLIDSFLPQNILLVGTRRITLTYPQIKRYSMLEINHEGLNEVCDAAMSAAREFSRLYLSIDLNVLDPAFAPAASQHEPGGLTTRELLYFLQRFKKLKNLNAADISGINPESIDDNTFRLLAKLVEELQ